MDSSQTHDRHRTGHGMLHMVLCCGLAILVILVSLAVDASLATALVVAALVLCPLSMVLMMRRTAGSSQAAAPQRGHDHETHS